MFNIAESQKSVMELHFTLFVQYLLFGKLQPGSSNVKDFEDTMVRNCNLETEPRFLELLQSLQGAHVVSFIIQNFNTTNNFI